MYKASSEEEIFLKMSDPRAARLLPYLHFDLQAYQTRATECGQTFEHMVLLEAAVVGWYVSGLLPALQCSGIDQACVHLCQEGTPSLHQSSGHSILVQWPC